MQPIKTKRLQTQAAETIQGKTIPLKARKKAETRRRALKSLLQKMTGIIDDLPSDLSINKYQCKDNDER